MPTSALRRLAVVVSFSLMLSVIPPVPPAVAQQSNDFQLLAAGIAAVGVMLDSVGQSEEFGEPLPLSSTSLASGDGLRLGSIFSEVLTSRMAQAIDSQVTTAGQLQDALSGDVTLDGVTFSIDGPRVDPGQSSTDPLIAVVPITIERPDATIDIRHRNVDANLDLADGGYPVALSATTTLTFEYDRSSDVLTPDERFSLVGEPALSAVVRTGDPDSAEAAEVELATFTSHFGFTEVEGAGQATVDLTVVGSLVDPLDDGRIRLPELMDTILPDLTDIRYSSTSFVDLGVTLRAPGGLLPDSETIEITLRAPAGTLPNLPDPDDPELGLNDAVAVDTSPMLSALAAVDDADALLGLSTLAGVIHAATAVGDSDIPFTDARLSDTFDPTSTILEFVQRRADGVIVCGSAATVPPSGTTVGADTIHCQALTAEKPTKAEWSVTGSGTIAANATNAATVGIDPAANITVTGVTAETHVSVAFTDTRGDHTVVPRFATAQEMLLQLQDAGFASADAQLAISQSDTGGALALEIPLSIATATAELDASWSLGDTIRSATGLAGLTQADGAPGPNLAVTDAAASTSLGMILVDEDTRDTITVGDTPVSPIGGDARFYVPADDEILRIESLSAATAARWEGMVGYLAVGAAADDVSIQPPADAPVASVTVSGTDAPVSVPGGGDFGGIVLMRDILNDVGAALNPTVSFEARATLQVSTSIDTIPSGTVELVWDRATGSLAPTTLADYRDGIGVFELVPDVTGVAKGVVSAVHTAADSPDTFVDDTTDFVAAGVSADEWALTRLSDGATCVIGTVSPTTLECSVVGSPAGPIAWAAGDEVALTEIGVLSDPNRDFRTDLGVALQVGDTLDVQVVNLSKGAGCSRLAVHSPTELACDLSTGADDSWWSAGDAYLVRGDPFALRSLILGGLIDAAGDLAGASHPIYRQPVTPLGVAPADVIDPLLAATQNAATNVAAASPIDQKNDDGTITPGVARTLQDLQSALAGEGPESLALSVALTDVDGAPHLGISAHLTERNEVPSELLIPLSDVTPGVALRSQNAQLAVGYDAAIDLDIAVPVVAAPDLGTGAVVLPTTSARVQMDVEQQDFDIDVEVGALTGRVSRAARAAGAATPNAPLTGAATNVELSATHTASTPSPTTLTDDNADFLAAGITDDGAWAIRRVSDGTTCLVDGVTATTITCTVGLGTGQEWATGDAAHLLSTITLEDANGDFSAVEVGDLVTNVTAGSDCPVVRVEDVSLSCDPPGMGAEGAWRSGDGYSIVEDPALVLTDPGADFTAAGVVAGDVLIHQAGQVDEATCTVGDVRATQLICQEPLTNQAEWDAGDTYRVPDPLGLWVHVIAEAGLDGGSVTAEPPCPAGGSGTCARYELIAGDGATPIGTLTTVATFDDPATPQSESAVATTGDTDALHAAISAFTLDWTMLTDGLEFLDDLLAGGLDGSLADTRLPLVGTDLDAGLDPDEIVRSFVSDQAVGGIGTRVQQVFDGAATFDEAALEGQIEEQVRAALAEALSDRPLAATSVTADIVCESDCLSAVAVSDLRIGFNLGPSIDAAETETHPVFDVGLPGLTLYSDAELAGRIESWGLLVEFGLDRNVGPYLAAGDAIKLEASNISVLLPDTNSCGSDPPGAEVREGDIADIFNGVSGCIPGVTGFLEADLWDRNTMLDYSLTLSAPADSDDKLGFEDLLSGRVGVTTLEGATGRIDLALRTRLSDAGEGFPTVVGTVEVTYTDGAFGIVEYGNLWLDLGSFLSGTVTPTLREIQRFTKPFDPVVEQLTSPIPVVSDMAELIGQPPITLLSLLEAASGNQLGMLTRLVKLIDFANSIPAQGNYIPLGDNGGRFGVDPLDVSVAACTSSESPSGVVTEDCFSTDSIGRQKTRPIGGTDEDGDGRQDGEAASNKKLAAEVFTGASLSGAGISFPFLTDAREIYGVLLGYDATLVRFDAGTLAATAGISITFGPFAVGPIPVEVSLGGSVTVAARFAMGYDTRGMRLAALGQDSITGSTLLDGVFIDDYDDNGNEVPEAKLVTTFTVGAAVSIKIFKAGIEGGIEITIALDLEDPNGDGKLRIEEIRQFRFNPICLFSVTGVLEFFLNFFLEIDLFLFKLKFSWEIFRSPPIQLFSVKCDPIEPNIADLRNGELWLNMGPYARAPFTGPDFQDETMRVTQTSGSTADWVRVKASMFGADEEFVVPRGTRIRGDGGTGSDAILLLPGAAAMEVVDGKINIDGSGDRLVTAADDGIYEIDGEERRHSDRSSASSVDAAAIDGIIDGMLPAGVTTFAGLDVIDGLVDVNGDGIIDGTDDGGLSIEQTFEFTLPAYLTGGEGNDRITTGAGDDVIDGGPGDDTLSTGAGRDIASTAGGNDSVDAGIGDDRIDTGSGDDQVNGGPGADLILGGPGADNLSGGPGLGTRSGAPPANVSPKLLDGNDIIIGGSGDDILDGDRADDVVLGDDVDAAVTIPTELPDMVALAADLTAGGTAACRNGAAGDGNDQVIGGAGNDWLFGGGGDDEISAGLGDDVACGNGGRDLIEGDEEDAPGGNDTLVGGPGDDRLYGRAGHDRLEGSEDRDTLWGGDDSDDLLGGRGSDALLGELGNDIIVGDDAVIATHPSVHPDAASAASAVEVLPVDDTAGSTACNLNIRIIDGGADVDGSGQVDGADTGSLNGVPVVAGKVDVDGDGVISETDTGFAGDLLIESGLVQASGSVPAVGYAGAADADCLWGGFGDDAMFGVDGADTMNGDQGNDWLDGNAGPDLIHGGEGNDTLTGGTGEDRLFGDSGDDTVFGDEQADILIGGPDDDVLYGRSGADELDGGEGNDVLIGGSPEAGIPDEGDQMRGGPGNDLLAGDNAVVRSFAGGAAVTLHDIPFELEGVPAPPDGVSGPDHIDGGPGNDRMYGQSGDDVLAAGPGDDVAEGNDGSDRITGDAGDDKLVGGSGDHLAPSIQQRQPLAGVRDRSTSGAGIICQPGEPARSGDCLDGGFGDDVMAGDNTWIDDGTVVLLDVDHVGARITTPVFGDDQLWGGRGDDRMFGQGGSDELAAGAGDDQVEGNHGNDLITGSGGNDRLVGGGSATDGRIDADRDGDGDNASSADDMPDGADVIDAGRGRDIVAGDNARIIGDTVTLFDVATVGSERPTVSSGPDTIDAGNGDDRVFGQGNGDQPSTASPLNAANGSDLGGDIITGGSGDDVIEGNHGADWIDGGRGQDDLIGGGSSATGEIGVLSSGDDLLDGADHITGGTGADVITGDNARIDATRTTDPNTGDSIRSIRLFDVETTSRSRAPEVSGSDYLDAGPGRDWVFGQGNGDQTGTPEGTGLRDVTPTSLGGDVIIGGDGDDVLEGNHGADWVDAGPGEDDIIGGSSAGDGLIGGARAPTILTDAGDVLLAGEEDDVALGDNGSISRRTDGAGFWIRIQGGAPVSFDFPIRQSTIARTPGPAGSFGGDLIVGGAGDDDLIGMLGDDTIEGNDGEDAVIGDLGSITPILEDGSRQEDIDVNGPFLADQIFTAGLLTREVELYSFEDGDGAGDDIITGGAGRDSLHGGPGDDLANGNADRDAVFGGHGDDAIWGGSDHDHLWGGYGDDHLDVYPQPDDPAEWAAMTVEDHYQGLDIAYGGWGQDALQSDVGGPGPQDGDRLIDWVGAYNVFYVCQAAYGESIINRQQSPSMRSFLQLLAAGDGAVDTSQRGSSGFGELGLVYPGDNRFNSRPPHPDHPGHFTCGP